MAGEKSYSRTQIVLHWLIVALVLVQYLAHDSIEALWRSRMRGFSPDVPTPDIHAAIGITIFLLMIWRLWLLFRNGAPALSEKEPRVLRIFARSVQGLVYLTLFALPLSGAAAWFFGVRQAVFVHGLLTNLLFALIALHVAGALIQHFWFKSDVLMRMLGRA